MHEAKTEADRLHVQKHLRFPGFIPEAAMKKYYANSDVLVFPSWHPEGFSMAIFQSVAAGLSIVTTKIRAAADYLHEPDNCLWVEPENLAEVAKAILQLKNNDTLRKTMSDNNKRLSTMFSEEIIASEYMQTYNTLLFTHE
jgi:glycosyltransferase involved in cell wall biosynthesis